MDIIGDLFQDPEGSRKERLLRREQFVVHHEPLVVVCATASARERIVRVSVTSARGNVQVPEL
jgi:hypothetical protein